MNSWVVYNPTSVNIGQRFKRKPLALLLQVDPGGECLFDDPTTRALKSSSQLVYFLRKGQRNMSSDYLCVHSNLAIMFNRSD
ncbi:hypothetical protein ORS3428_04080 [Mesorhizobium sp. ORS 3428]|nr:hypothetical protein ORS3428_04080 [Mesorhizobium sp. ORS 3428]